MYKVTWQRRGRVHRGLNPGVLILFELHMFRIVLSPVGDTKEGQHLVLALQEEGRKHHHCMSITLSGVKVGWQCQSERPRMVGKCRLRDTRTYGRPQSCH